MPTIKHYPRRLKAGKELTIREKDVYRLAAQGYSAVYIASRLHLSKRTVETHLESIYRKLGITSRAQLVRHAETLAD